MKRNVFAGLFCYALVFCALVPFTAAQTAEQWYQQGARAVVERSQQKLNTNRAKNVILFVADGMGISTITAARIFDGQSRGENGEENSLSFERFPHVAMVKTYNTNAQVPDSAGTASAMTTGIKTGIGVIAQTDSQAATCYGVTKDFPKTIIEYAEEEGMSTGVVSTAEITHATPAAAYAHAPTRKWQADSDIPKKLRKQGCQDIAQQLVNFSIGDGVDVILGGGKDHFVPKTSGGDRLDGNLITQWQQRFDEGVVVNNAQELAKLSAKQSPVLGLFSSDHMAFEADRSETKEPSLTEMTDAAIKALSTNEKGYFLMVESGRVDHAHHATNAYRALGDAQEFSRAVAKAIELVDLDDTLILVTADHSHVFTMAGYPDRGNPILGFVARSDEGSRDFTLAKDNEPYTTLGYANGPNVAGSKRKMPAEGEAKSPNYLQQSTVEMSSETHGGEDVALFAAGPWAHLANGVVEQHEIFHIIDYAMGLTKK